MNVPSGTTKSLLDEIPSRSLVHIQVFNVLVQNVAELVNAEQSAGHQTIVWDANTASGIYFYRIEATDIDNPNNRFVGTKRMILLK